MRTHAVLPTLAALIAGLTVLAAPARAQHGSMATSLFSEEAHFSPEFSARDLKVMIGVLDLKPEEQEALSALYTAYADTLRAEGAAVREAVSEALERAEIMNDAGLMAPGSAAMEKWSARSEEIKASFLADLKSLLTREQESRWPILERELRRIKRVGSGQVTGESVDLVRLVEGALEGSAVPAAVAELLARYRDELDRALIARDMYLDAVKSDYRAALKDDPARGLTLWKEARHRRVAVRDCNERFARQIAPELPPEHRASFEERVFELSFPMLAKDTRTDTYLKDAAALTSLTPEQTSELSAVANRHRSQRTAWQREAAAAWRLYEDAAMPSDLAGALGESAGDENRNQYNGAWLDESHPLTAARRARYGLDRTTRAGIDRILTPRQREEVPSRTSPMARFDDWSPWGL